MSEERDCVLKYLHDVRLHWLQEAERCWRNRLAVTMAESKAAVVDGIIKDIERDVHRKGAKLGRQR